MTKRADRGKAQPHEGGGFNRVGIKLGALGGNKEGDPKYWFGTGEEIANRVATGYDLVNPAANPPAFKQIEPGNTGKDLNNPDIARRAGHIKFSGEEF